MKFRYILVDEDGSTTFTNDEEKVRDKDNLDYFLIGDLSTGEWLNWYSMETGTSSKKPFEELQ